MGNIAGVATSVPELLTVSFSAASGLMATSIANILSSNVINTILYTLSIFFNKNTSTIKNKAIRVDLVLVGITILIPILVIALGLEIHFALVPLFILLFILFYWINTNAHKLYLKEQESKMVQEIEQEEKWLRGKKQKTIFYAVCLLLTAILLFFVGNALSGVLENLCITFGISQNLIGILLGFATSIPELITFFEAQKHYKKKEDQEEGVVEATNNLLSSNMLNLFIIQSVGIVIFMLFSH